MSLEQLGIKSFVDTAKNYSPEFDTDAFKKVIPYGISYLDKMLYGIMPDDLVLIGAPSGVGKSELASMIAVNAAYNGKRVVPFALEATFGEWELRTKYRMYSAALEKERPETIGRFTYLDFKLGLMRKMIEPYRKSVEEVIEGLRSMMVFYRGNDFTVKDFTRVFNSLNDKTDLVVVDHLHYIDSAEENENKAFSDIMKKVRDLNQITGIPVVMIGHLRKGDRKEKPLAASLEDFHGTSNIAKISTTIITLGSGEMLSDHRFQTYFRIAKARGEGRVTRYCGLGIFNSNTNEYEKNFVLGRLTQNEKEFEPIPIEKHPRWYTERKST